MGRTRVLAAIAAFAVLSGALLGQPTGLVARTDDGLGGGVVAVSPNLPGDDGAPGGADASGAWPLGDLATLGTRRALVGAPPGTLPTLDAAGVRAAEDARQELIDWIDGMLTVYPHLAAHGGSAMQEALLKVRAEVETMTPEQIAAAKAEIGSHPGFWEFPDFLLSLFDSTTPSPPYYATQMRRWASFRGIEQTAAGDTALAVPTPQPTPLPFPTRDPFPDRTTLPDRPPSRDGCPGAFKEDTCEECPDGVPLEALFAAKVVTIIAKGLNDSSGTASQDVCAPPGVGFTVPNFVKYIFIAAAIAAEATEKALEFSRDLEEDCEDGFHAALIDLYLDETVSSRLSQASLDEHARLMLRIAIENNLLNLADDRISLFQLPESACGDAVPDDDPAAVSGMEGYRYCGKLELVREIVDETIEQNAAAGTIPEILQARNELAAGDAHYDLQQWKSAYERYSAAYRYAVKQPVTR